MIENSGKFFIYRHIRLDKNEPFYIGIGTKNLTRKSYKKIYWRAFSHEKRNIFWKRIVAKTDYEIEYLCESEDYSFMLKKEIEFIKLHGRRDLGLGTLTNLTDGGEGTTGIKHTQEYKDNQSKKRLGIKRDPISVEKTAKARRKKIYQYDLEGNFIREFESCREASKFLKRDEDAISNCARGKNKSTYGFQWFYEFKGEKTKKLTYIKNHFSRKIIQKSLEGEIIGYFNSIKEASLMTNSCTASIGKCCSGKQFTSNGFLWEYDNTSL